MSAYIKLSTMEYPRHIGDIQIDPAGMSDYAKVEWVDPPQYNNDREYIIEDVPEKTHDGWKMKWLILQIPFDILAKKVRTARDQLLKDTDWRVIKALESNIPQDFDWAAYRQALRDVPTQAGFPWEVQWPTKPE